MTIHEKLHKIEERVASRGEIGYEADLLAIARELDAELQAVMHSVDKWFDEMPNDNPATRAADAREIALKAIDKLDAELYEAIALLKASHYTTEIVAQGTKYRHTDGCSICAFLARHKEADNVE